MKHFSFRQLVSAFLVLVLLAAAAFATVACTKQNNDPQPQVTDSQTGTQPENPEAGKTFTLKVILRDGTEKEQSVTTDKETVGAALLAEKLIAGENGQYGLYVKTVCGETLDYDADGMYWAFYIDGTYASTGVDQTPVTAGAIYLLKAES